MRIEVDCRRIRRNAEAVVKLCASQGIEVVGVTKACCGHPEVARAMLAGGVRLLADSRLQHLRRLRQAGIQVPLMLLRIPALSEAEEVVTLAQVSLNSEVATARRLSQAARAQDLVHRVILMVETGDRREGVMPGQAAATARSLAELPNLELVGVGTNLNCIGGVLPSRENMQLLIRTAREIEEELNIRLPVISGGHTANLDLVDRGEIPSRVNQLRIGEAILQGVNSFSHYPLPLPYRDAFTVVAEVIELKTKPSLPEGSIAVDSYGRVPHWEDCGERRRAILALGGQDLYVDGLRPKRPGISIVGSSSDHLVVDVTEADPPLALGEELAFDPSYHTVATGMARRGLTQVIKPHTMADAAGDTI